MKSTPPSRHPARAGVPGRLRLPVDFRADAVLERLYRVCVAVAEKGGAESW